MSTVTMQTETRKRIPAAERREQILVSASQLFGVRGYVGTTTEQIAQAAGISQPYVVRMFGSKEQLFIEVIQRSLLILTTEFRAVIAAHQASTDPQKSLGRSLGLSYVGLLEDRGILLSLMQGYLQGHDPVIGVRVREGFIEVYRLLRDEAGMTPEMVRGFLAEGMLLNTLLALRLPSIFGEDADADELMACTFQSKLDVVLDLERN